MALMMYEKKDKVRDSLLNSSQENACIINACTIDRVISSTIPTYTNTKRKFFWEGIRDMENGQVKDYLERIANKFDNVSLNAKIMNGMPVIKNTRIPASLILACLRDEMTIEEICRTYRISEEKVEEIVSYVIEVLDIPFQGEDDEYPT